MSGAQLLYISHGGGPMPILGDPSHHKMVEFLKKLGNSIHEPRAIVVLSAHWEEPMITIQSGDQPDLMYDYYGFPQEAYAIKYPCKGAPQLAERISQMLNNNGIENALNSKRPYDHGSYIPLLLMYPDAQIPVIQVSLNSNLDPMSHFNLGKSLKPLLNENILFIGSGFSFHNMRAFRMDGLSNKDELNDVFQDALINLCTTDGPKSEGCQRWESIKGARYCHPREEHLLPLFVLIGFDDKPFEKVFDDYIIGKRAVAFYKNYSF